MTSRGFLLAGALGLLLAASPAWAEHNGAPPLQRSLTRDAPGTEQSIDIDLKIGVNGFRLGSWLFGRDGYTGGAWINGQARRDGFSLEGRVEHEGKAHEFRFNADIDEALQRMLRWPGAAPGSAQGL